MIPLLLRPRWYSLINHWFPRGSRARRHGRDFALLFFSAVVIFCLYFGTHHALTRSTDLQLNQFLAPELPLSIYFTALLIMLFLASVSTTLGAMYLSRDLELVLSSPISTRSLFYGKFTDVALSSAWMIIVFSLPVMAAFGIVFKAEASYYIAAVLLLLPLIVIPAGLAYIAVVVLACLIPATRGREVFLAACGLVILGALFSLRMDEPTGRLLTEAELVDSFSRLKYASAPWLPSSWLARSLGNYLVSDPLPAEWAILALVSVSSLLIYGSYIVTRDLHAYGYARAVGSKSARRLKSQRAHRYWTVVIPFMRSPMRAIAIKEYKLFARDMTQAVQLILLVGLCLIYLYNFRFLQNVEGISENTELWWRSFMVLSNLAMGAFVTTAVCTRFVFPSVSLEGKAFWILQAAPLDPYRVLRAKFLCWLLPVAGISSIIFSSGALAIDAPPRIVAVSALSSFIICYGVVGLAIGLGAMFANFEWEHSSQLAASLGSLIYMFASMLLVFVNLIPTATLIGLRTLHYTGQRFDAWEWSFAVLSCSFLLVYANYSATRWALALGDTALRNRTIQ